MSITVSPAYLESNHTHLRKVPSAIERRIISPSSVARRGGSIVNFSIHNLLVWFGKNPPADLDDWLEIPYRANCDIPLFYVGEIHGVWMGDDNRTAKIYEFQGS